MAVGALLEHPDRIRVQHTTSVHPAWAAWFPLGLAPGAGRPCVRPNIRPRTRAAAWPTGRSGSVPVVAASSAASSPERQRLRRECTESRERLPCRPLGSPTGNPSAQPRRGLNVSVLRSACVLRELPESDLQAAW